MSLQKHSNATLRRPFKVILSDKNLKISNNVFRILLLDDFMAGTTKKPPIGGFKLSSQFNPELMF